MNRNWRPIARRVALIISILSLLVGIGYYIVMREWNLYLQISLGLFIIGLAVYVALDPGAVRTALTGRQARHGSNAFILTVAFVGILIVINYLSINNNKRWDLTADKTNTLANETLEVLNSLPETIVAKAFFTSDSMVATSKENARELFDKYVYESDGKFKYEFIDPNKDPVTAQEAGITKDGTIVLYMGDTKQAVAYGSEQELTGAMVRLMNPGGHAIYFLTGHGEFPIEGGGDQTYSLLKAALEAKNYTVTTLNLLATPNIPEDASVVIVAGPQKPLAESEVSILDAFLQGGGSVIVMEEPVIITQFGEADDPLADYLVNSIGVTLGNDMVVDVQAAQTFQQPFIAISNQYADHPITQKMGGMATFFPTSRSVSTDDSAGSEYTKTALILTSDQSWAETDMRSIEDGSMQPDEGVDLFGPVPLAVTAEGMGNEARLVVFGDSEFAVNAYYQVYGNGDLIINSIDWAAREESLISLTPKTTVERYMAQPQPYTMGLILLGSLIILPGVVLVAGVATWIHRRRQG